MNDMAKMISLIPRPVHLAVGDGYFELTSATKIQSAPDILAEASELAQRLRCATGLPLELSVATGEAVVGSCICMELREQLPFKSAEGYCLQIKPLTVSIQALSSTGVAHAIQTFLQLFPAAVFSHGPRNNLEWRLPCLSIEDYPRFSWRGAMLDCSRFYKPVSFIKKFINLLAVHKLNTFHWHLTDDQGWRIEIKKYPRLTEVGAWRGGTQRGHYDLKLDADNIPHGGYYTQDEIRDIVAYAAARHITVVPEIEMPGHAQAAIAAYPQFGCTAAPLEPWTRWGISENIYNPKEETIEFLQDVLREVMDLFPSRFIHIGGDEAVKTQWKENPEVLALMGKLGINDTDALQSYLVKRMSYFLAENGRRLVGWDEILEGGLAPDATVMSWRGTEHGIKAAEAGHDAIMAPVEFTYLDNYQSADIRSEPLAIGGHVSLEKVYEFDPVARSLSADKSHHILGLQGQLWSEYMPTTEQVEYMAFPRLCALAEVGWSSGEAKDYPEFRQRLATHLKRLDVLGVRYRPLSD